MDDIDYATQVLQQHGVDVQGVTQWCCACTPRVWRDNGTRERHLAEMIVGAGMRFGQKDVPHEHTWERKQNVTTKGYVMPPYEVCGCGAARKIDAPTPAEAWDEGMTAGRSTDVAAETQPTNPYRAALDGNREASDEQPLTPDAHFAAAKAEGAAEVAEEVAAEYRAERQRLSKHSDPEGLLHNYLGGWRDAEKVARARAARLREQGGE